MQAAATDDCVVFVGNIQGIAGMALFSRILGTRGGAETQQAVAPANDLSIQQEEKSLNELRASLEASYSRPDAAGLQEQIGGVADQFDGVHQRLEQKASGDARYADTRKLLDAAVNETDHVQRGSNLIQLMAACDQAMTKSGADQGLLRETKDAAKKMLELGKKEADLAQQEVKARQQSRRVSAKRAQQAANEQKKQQAEAQQRREKQEEDVTKGLNATAADQQAAQASRTKTGAARIGGDAAGEEYESAEEKLETSLADANQPAGAGADVEGREGAAFAGRSELQGSEQSGLEAGVEGGELAADTEAPLDPSLSGDEFFELFDGVRRRRVKKRKPDGSLLGLQEILEEGVGIDQINILDFIQDPVLLKYFDIALNRQLGEIRQRYGEDAIILWTITELARAVIAQGLGEKGLAGAELPPSLRRPRTPTEEAVAEACKGALFGYIN